MAKKSFLDYAGLKRIFKKMLWRGTKAELTTALAAGEIANGTTVQVTDDYDSPEDPDVTVGYSTKKARIVENDDIIAFDSSTVDTETWNDITYYRAQFFKNCAGVEFYKIVNNTASRVWSTESDYYNGVDTLEQLVTDSKIAVNLCSRKWYRFRNCTNNPTGGTSTDDNDYFVMAQFIEKNDTQQWIRAIAYDIRTQAIYTNSRFGTDAWSGWKSILKSGSSDKTLLGSATSYGSVALASSITNFRTICLEIYNSESPARVDIITLPTCVISIDTRYKWSGFWGTSGSPGAYQFGAIQYKFTDVNTLNILEWIGFGGFEPSLINIYGIN